MQWRKRNFGFIFDLNEYLFEIHTFGADTPAFDCWRLPTLPWKVEFGVDVNIPLEACGRRDGNELLLFIWLDRNSKFSRSKAACCNFSSLIADMSSSFWVSSDERVNISCNQKRHSKLNMCNAYKQSYYSF